MVTIYNGIEHQKEVLEFDAQYSAGGKPEIVFQKPISEKKPKVSIILLDWNCRESFHILKYLDRQNVSRADFEVIWVEYYANKPQKLQKMVFARNGVHGEPLLDQWIILNMHENTYYHKHLMYNVGIAASRGEIIVIMDSDAFVSPSFVQNIITFFAQNEKAILHLDEVRNISRKFYPFNYPLPDDVLGKGCINWKKGKTTGLWDKADILHTRNYGACFCARRTDIISIGGADEHIDYLGHICGPYDLTFRLINRGLKEVWHETEFLYHTWHPGTDGVNNYLGPHDGSNLSTTALAALYTGRVMPWNENPAIRMLRTRHESTMPYDVLHSVAIDEVRVQNWQMDAKKQTVSLAREKWNNGERKGALADWKYAVAIWQEDLDLQEEAAEAFRIAGYWDEAIRIVDRILKIDSSLLLAQAEKAHGLLHRKQYREAYEMFSNITDILLTRIADDPRYHIVLRNGYQKLGWCLIQLQEYAEARCMFIHAQQLTRPDELAVQSRLAYGLVVAAVKSGFNIEVHYKELFACCQHQQSILMLIRKAVVKKAKLIIRKTIFYDTLRCFVRGR